MKQPFLERPLKKLTKKNKRLKPKIKEKETKIESSRCPAVILAVNRIDKVTGRIITLIISIKIIKGIRM